MTLAARRAVAVLGAGLLIACRAPQPPPLAPEPPLPPPAPIGVHEITALEVTAEQVWAGTTAGVLVLTPDSGAWRLHSGDAVTSHERVTALDVAADGTAWTGHAALPEEAEPGEAESGASASPAAARPAPRRGGVRRFGSDGGVTAYFVADGLPSDDVVALAAGEGFVVVATSAGLARLTAKGDGFEPVALPARRRLTVVHPEAGGATRTVTELRPRDERVTALAAGGTRLWMGTTHGLLVRDGDAEMRVVLPACRRDGVVAPVVTALGLRPDGIVAALGLVTASGIEPSGVVEVTAQATAAACHVPGVDVPAALTPSVASDGRTTWLATYEGVVRLQGRDVALFERGRGMPERPPTAVAVGPDGAAWFGFWGDGLARLRGDALELFRFAAGGEGTALPERRSVVP